MIDLLLNNLNLVLEADGDAKRVRDAVLQLAVRGRLVAQNPEDEPALEAVRIARDKWFSGASTRERKNHSSDIDASEQWFELPVSWCWSRIPWVTSGAGQQAPKKNFRYVDISSIDGSEGAIDWAQVDEISATDAPSRARKNLARGSVIYSSVRPYQRKIAIFDTEDEGLFIASTGFQVLTADDSLLAGFLWCWLRSDDFDDFAAIFAKGAAYPAINDRDFSKGLVPLPPLAEQHRIVAKVDELMDHASVLEERHQAASSARVRLRDSALHALAEAEDAEAVETAWQRIETHFEDLFTEPEDIQPLRQTILQLAVRGRLVAQDPEDEGETLTLSEVGKWGAGRTPSRQKPHYFEGDVNWFKSGELPDGEMCDPSEEKISTIAIDECRMKVLEPGVVVIALYGATTGRVGILRVAGTTNQAVLACTPNNRVVGEFLFLILKSLRDHFLGERAGGAQPNISKAKVVDVEIYLPPLAEQHRIVEKVDELMSLCDEVESRLEEAKQARERFASSVSAALVSEPAIQVA